MKYVILAGGKGSRLWPLSSDVIPKQFLHFGEAETLLQKTVLRFYPKASIRDIWIVTSKEYVSIVDRQLRMIDVAFKEQILIEPESRNTGPAIAFAMKYLEQIEGVNLQECVLVCSSDHVISPQEAFWEAVQKAEKFTGEGLHGIFGIYPHRPETGYGYVKARPGRSKEIWDVEEFVEKPNYEQARKYVLSGEYLWNAGIFLFQMGAFFEEISMVCPKIGELLSEPFDEMLERFSEMPNISIDCALMEKSKRIFAMPLHLAWFDIGSWDSVYEVCDKDGKGNVKMGQVIDIETKNCLIMGGYRPIATIGVEGLLIVDTEEGLLIAKAGESQKVKEAVTRLDREEQCSSLSWRLKT